jgi:hypothetical protein
MQYALRKGNGGRSGIGRGWWCLYNKCYDTQDETDRRYAYAYVYLLYQFKSTSTDTWGDAELSVHNLKVLKRGSVSKVQGTQTSLLAYAEDWKGQMKLLSSASKAVSKAK